MITAPDTPDVGSKAMPWQHLSGGVSSGSARLTDKPVRIAAFPLRGESARALLVPKGVPAVNASNTTEDTMTERTVARWPFISLTPYEPRYSRNAGPVKKKSQSRNLAWIVKHRADRRAMKNEGLSDPPARSRNRTRTASSR
jgi:hypothetical protein